MSTFHHHLIRCPRCGAVAYEIGCRVDDCHFPVSWASADELRVWLEGVPGIAFSYSAGICSECKQGFLYIVGNEWWYVTDLEPNTTEWMGTKVS